MPTNEVEQNNQNTQDTQEKIKNNEGNNFITDIQRSSHVFSFPSDKNFYTFNYKEFKRYPKSLFYEATTAIDDPASAVFAYYLLGDNSEGSGKENKYHNSEKTEYLKEITQQASRNPTAKMIIDVTSAKTNGIPAYADPDSPYRGQIYNVKDFIFCKHYGIIPNNRMITLRRFPYPTLDSLKLLPKKPRQLKVIDGEIQIVEETAEGQDSLFNTDMDIRRNYTLPIAQAVTYFGKETGNDLNQILRIITGLNFEYETQNVLLNEKTGDPGMIGSFWGDMINNLFNSTFNKSDNLEISKQLSNFIGSFITPEKNINRLKRYLLDGLTSGDGPLSKKIFVDVNTVNQMMVRKVGFVGGTNAITLTFEYNLTSVGSINTKILFLDLLTNILALGADYGHFLSPELRLEQMNVGIGYPGGAKGYIQSILKPLEYIKKQVASALSGENINSFVNVSKQKLENIFTEINNYINNYVNNYNSIISINKDFYKSVSVMLSDLFLRQIYYQPIMLSGYPTGEWHLVIGNPLNPIAMIGNLVCTRLEITFDEELGPDDFPVGFRAVFTLHPARQRHRGDWESMFNRGRGRFYHGQLVFTGESTQAYMNADGVMVNDLSNYKNNNQSDIIDNLASAVTKNVSPKE